MPVDEVPLGSVGLLSVAEAAARLGRSVSGVQKLISRGYLPAVVAGAGRRRVYLIRESDVRAFVAPPVGAAAHRPKRKARRKPA